VTYELLTCVQFIREDLQHGGDDAAVRASFHGADDFISVYELWQIWINSTGKSLGNGAQAILCIMAMIRH